MAILPAWLESLGQMLSHRAASQVGSDLRIGEKLQLQKMFVSLFIRYLDFSNETLFLSSSYIWIMLTVNYIFTGSKVRVSCGRAAALFLIGVRCSIRNQLGFIVFIDVIGNIIFESFDTNYFQFNLLLIVSSTVFDRIHSSRTDCRVIDLSSH